MQVHQDYPLKRYNTFGINAIAKHFTFFHSTEDLKNLLDYKNCKRKMILGGGSNILFTKNYDGFILKNEIPGIEIIKEENDEVFVRVGAGVNWHSFVIFCVNNNFGGVENLSLIPGNAGTSPMQNIGAYGVEIKDVFSGLEAFHLQDKSVVNFSSSDCEFGYRESIFKKKYKDQFAILNVTFRLNKKPIFNISYGAIEKELEKMKVQNLSIKSVSDAVIQIRSSKLPDPAKIGSAGSFFKNPIVNQQKMDFLISTFGNINLPFYKTDEQNFKISAGWLIEQCGWKGYRNGDAGCYGKQALVLVNYGKASGEAIFNLSEEIKNSVNEKFTIDLEREVNIL